MPLRSSNPLKARRFEFPAGSDMTQVRDTIAAAVDDEACRIVLRQGERIVCVQMDVNGEQRDVVMIPESRIVPRGYPRAGGA